MTGRTLWCTVCAVDEILPDMGVAALVGGEQIAIFRVDDTVYALANRDPFSGANVLARGIVGDIGGVLVVASPIYKQHFRLADGVCLEDAEVSVASYPVRIVKGAVQIGRVVGTTSLPNALDALDTLDTPTPTGATGQRAASPALTAVPGTPSAPLAGAVAPAARPAERLVVIGNGMAGMRVVEELCRIAPDRYDITIFGAEPTGNYNRIMLSSHLADEVGLPDIMLHDHDWYAAEGIELCAGDAVVSIDRRRRLVHAASGRTVRYDRLLIATGSTPNRLAVPGAALEGILTFRDLDDVAAMRAAAATGRRAVVIGGGLLGLEAAHGLSRNGMAVTVVHRSAHLMERQLDAPAGELLRAALEARGIGFRLGAHTAAFEGVDRIAGVRLASGELLAADLVVLAIGITPNVDLACAAGLFVRRGIAVDDTLQTFDPRVYAVGECTEHRGQLYGLVAPLYEQARVCAAHLAGVGHLSYRGSFVGTALKVTGIEVVSAGDVHARADPVSGVEELVLRDAAAGVYKRLVVRHGRLVGVLLVGDATDGGWYQDLIKSAANIEPLRHGLLFGRAHVELPVAA